jgi:hypothetical protein
MSEIETVCQTCIFATYEDPTDDALQTGCLAGRLDKFKETGVELIEYEDEHGHKFFGIPNRLCVYYRNKNWLDRQPEEDDKVAIVRDEITLRMEAIIYINSKSNFQDMGLTVDSLSRGKIKPTTITFCDHKNIKPSTFRKWVEGRCNKMGWRAEHIREPKSDFLRCVDICMKRVKTQFVSVFSAGFKVPEDFISSLDIALNDDMERFLYLEPIDGKNGMVVQRVVSKNYRGNAVNPLLEKLREESLEQECPEMVRKITELVPSMDQISQQSQSSSRVITTLRL